MLELRNICYSVSQSDIIKNISLTFRPGELSVIIGPNGSGKSTLLKLASGEYQPSYGEVYYGSKKMDKKKFIAAAAYRAVLTQHSELNFPLTVIEVVSMGRYPHFVTRPSAIDVEIVNMAISRFKLHNLKERNYLTLSGGEQQRVQYARIFAQLWNKNKEVVRFLLLDEPVAFLDLNFQHEFLVAAKEMAQSGEVVVSVLHDINLAGRYADKVFAIKGGSLIASGKPDDMITSELIFELYGVKCDVFRMKNNRPFVIAEEE